MDEQDVTAVVVVCTDKKLLEQLAIDAQWPEDRAAYKQLVEPTNLTEIGL